MLTCSLGWRAAAATAAAAAAAASHCFNMELFMAVTVLDEMTQLCGHSGWKHLSAAHTSMHTSPLQ